MFPAEQGMIGGFGNYIQVLINGRKMDVHHADFLSLINEGRTALEDVGGSKHGSGFTPERLVPVAGKDPGMVMIFKVEGIPTVGGENALPFAEGALQLSEGETMMQVFGDETVGHGGIELNQHVKDTVFAADVVKGMTGLGIGHFADLDGTVFGGNPAVFAQVPEEIRTFLVVGKAVDGGNKGQTVWHVLGLRDVVDHILPESIHAHIEPEPHDGHNFLADLWIVHVEVRLFSGKDMQVILLTAFAVFPGESLKLAVPVVGRELAFLFEAGIAPDVLVTVGIIPAFTALNEPGVLVRGVVDHEVKEHLEAK